MAEIADEEGRGVRVSQRTLVERCSFSERTVRRALEGLVAQGLIRLGDQSLVLHLPAGQRPVVWDLVINGSAVAPDELTPATLTTHPGHSDHPPRPERPLTPVTATTHPGQPDHPPRPQRPVNPGHTDRPTPVTVTDKASLEASVEASSLGATKPRRKAKPMTPLPDDWKPNDTHNRICQELGLSTEQARMELENFRDHARSRGSRYRDWDAAFRTWLRNTTKFDRKPRRRPDAVAAAEKLKHNPDPDALRRAWPSQAAQAADASIPLRSIPGGLA
ncbi:hypothetical protein IU482_30330 [Nocardia farcinica]|nr:hypothetical protein [Nocardia farcinica]